MATRTDIALGVFDTRTSEFIAQGEAVVAVGNDVSVTIPLSVTLDAQATYALLVRYGDGVVSYRLLDPAPAGQGGFPYVAGDGMVRVLEAGFSSPVVLPASSILLPMLAAEVLPCSEPETPFRRGDANSDGDVDLSDAISTLQALFVGPGIFPCEDAADTNDDGALDISDVITTLVTLFQTAIDIPAPGPTSCGEDPTEDSLSCREYEACAPPRADSAFVNGVPLSASTILSLEQDYGIVVIPGDYWYDRVSGAYGTRGKPTMGFILAGLAMGGPLQADASMGNTGVFINGRELPRTELDALELILGQVPSGRYWLDGQGDYGYEGEPALGNLIAALVAARETSGGDGYLERTYFGSIGSDGQTSYFFDSSTGCSVISGGGVSC